MKSSGNILIVGVGGQGTLLASKIIGGAMTQAGLDVKVSEVHGMSQRGGSVVTYVKYGKKVYSPMIELGEADVILAFEELEAARYLAYLKEGGTIIVNKQKIAPMPVITGAAIYPENLLEDIKRKGVLVEALDAFSLAKEAGNFKAVNVVLIGAFAAWAGFSENEWEDAVRENVPGKLADMNVRAFGLGFNERK